MKKPVSVIKFGGSLGQNAAAKKKFFRDMADIAKRQSVVLVHGGGPEINHWLSRLGIQSKFVNGLRYTDEATLEVVEMVLSGKVNKGIVAGLGQLGAKAVGLSGKDGKTALCARVKQLGFVGEPKKIDTGLVDTLLAGGYLPVVSSLGLDAQGQTLNINADALAMALAIGLKADRLVLLTDVCGVLDEQKKTIPVIRVRDIDTLLDRNVITGGMIPKIKACRRSIECGINEVWIVDGCAGLKKMKGTVIK